MNKKTAAIILVGAVVIIGGFGGYKAYANHLDEKYYQEVQTSINKLFSDRNHKILSNHVDEVLLQADQKKINRLKAKEKKVKLSKELKKARSLLKTEELAKKDVGAILKDGILQDKVTSLQIGKAEKLVKGLTDKALRETLQKKLDAARTQLTNQKNAVKTVTSLFSDETHNVLADKVTRDTYNNAKQLTEGVQNETMKQVLTDLLAKADAMLSKAEKEQAEAKAKEEEEKKAASNIAQTPVSSHVSSQPASNSSVMASSQPGVPQVTGFAQIVANSKTAQRTDQIVTVVASGTSAKVTLWEKSNNMWGEIFTTSGFVGSQGVGQASEGSKRTPKGAYTLGFAFGQSNPGTKLPFKQITQNSYWISDVNSDMYNTWQEGQFAGNGNEHLADYANLQYYYAIVINYNTNAVKGAGSAFFLHVSNGRPTAGCVSVPKSNMEQLMKRIHSGAYIVNVTSQDEVSDY